MDIFLVLFRKREQSLMKPKKIAIIAGSIALVIFGTYYLTAYSFHREFQILYSLDSKQNDQAVIDLIHGARKYVYFAIYTFTKDNIAEALISAKNRGLDVQGITDLAQSQSDFERPIVKKLADAGIKLETQKHPDGIMHIKAVVTDQGFASGSYNWTQSATVSNDEILEVGHDKSLHDQYLKIIKKVLAENTGTDATVAGTSIVAQTETGTPAVGSFDFTQANSHIGETAKVSGKVFRVYTSAGGTTFFDYCQNYKSCPFSAVVFASAKAKFPNLTQYQGRDITVKGKISSYQGQAEMILNSPDQIVP